MATGTTRQDSTSGKGGGRKIVQEYEAIFTKEPMELLSSRMDFWDELFLLQPNLTSLHVFVKEALKEKGTRRLSSINLLFSQASVALKDDSNIRISNALLTLCVISRTVLFKKKKPPSKQLIFDEVEVLIGKQDLDVKLEILRNRLCELLFSDIPSGMKSLILDFILILVTWNDNLSDNIIVENLMSDHLFDAIITVTMTLTSRQVLGFKALLLLTLLVNFNKKIDEDGTQSIQTSSSPSDLLTTTSSNSVALSNPYIVKLSIVHNEVALNGFAHVICSEFYEFNRKYEEKHPNIGGKPSGGGIFSSLTHMMGSMFIGDDGDGVHHQGKGCSSSPLPISKGNLPYKSSNALLLALYHAILLNRNFITLLTNFAAEPLVEHPSINGNTSSLDKDKEANTKKGMKNSSTTSSSTNSTSPSNLSGTPSNLLVSFLEFCSIVMLNTKDEASCRTSRLCFVILTIISEDQCANAIMHDSNIAFRVQLHRMPMRHRKVVSDSNRPSQPLSHTVLDLMVEFIQSNLRKSLPLDLHSLALGIIRRIICYQTKCNIRFDYHWTEVWSALISLIKYLVNHESELIKIFQSNKQNQQQQQQPEDIFHLILTAVNIFNLFIMYGDTFLPSADAYDQLYYELIRMHIVFDNLYQLGVRYSSQESSPFRDLMTTKVVPALVNIRAIINHFTPKIDSYSSINEVESLTEENVLEVVRNNYDSLILKLSEGLDGFDPYSSQDVKEKLFHQEMLQQVMTDYRDSINPRDPDVTQRHALLLKEILAIES